MCFAKNLNCFRLHYIEWEVLHKKFLQHSLQLVNWCFRSFLSWFSLVSLCYFDKDKNLWSAECIYAHSAFECKEIFRCIKYPSMSGEKKQKLQRVFYQQTSGKKNNITKIFWISLLWHAGNDTSIHDTFLGISPNAIRIYVSLI